MNSIRKRRPVMNQELYELMHKTMNALLEDINKFVKGRGGTPPSVIVGTLEIMKRSYLEHFEKIKDEKMR